MFRLAASLVFLLCFAMPSWAVNVDVLQAKRPPKLLSETGLFKDGAKQIPADGVHPYALVNELFTDYALKKRFVFVPQGKVATYQDSESLDFPVGSVLVKNFGYSADLSKPDEQFKLIETRLLIHREDGWHAWAYIWKDDQSDAVLKVAGGTQNISFIDLQGQQRDIRYVVPNKNQCKGCHIYKGAVAPIGPKGRSLNRDFTYGAQVMNQLEYWRDHGLLDMEGTQPSHMVDWQDETASLDLRARAYLDVNCAHCHRLEGPASTSGLYLTYEEQNPVTWGLNKRPVAAGRGSGGLNFDIVPGKPEESILLYRMDSNEPEIRMPETGRTIIHAEGIALIKYWIESLDD